MSADTNSDVRFVIQRPGDFAEWFVGFNECGPMWSSSFAEAAEVLGTDLVQIMVKLAKHDPSASLL